MARLLSQTLRHITTATRTLLPPPIVATSSLVFLHHRHTLSGKPQLIEVDLDSSSDEVRIRTVEEMIQHFILERAAPSWLPFIPGSSYWIPPNRKPINIVDWLGKLANPLTEEEIMSFTSIRGWPCSSFFLEGGQPLEVNVEGSAADSVEVEAEVRESTQPLLVNVEGSTAESGVVEVEVHVEGSSADSVEVEAEVSASGESTQPLVVNVEGSSADSVEVEAQVEVLVHTDSTNKSKSEDGEG